MAIWEQATAAWYQAVVFGESETNIQTAEGIIWVLSDFDLQQARLLQPDFTMYMYIQYVKNTIAITMEHVRK
jgi:hypothetical protein